MTIHHQIAIRAPRSAVYRAIAEPAQIGRWWGAQTPVPTPEGLVLEHQAGPYGTVRLRVVDLQPDAHRVGLHRRLPAGQPCVGLGRYALCL